MHMVSLVVPIFWEKVTKKKSKCLLKLSPLMISVNKIVVIMNFDKKENKSKKTKNKKEPYVLMLTLS